MKWLFFTETLVFTIEGSHTVQFATQQLTPHTTFCSQHEYDTENPFFDNTSPADVLRDRSTSNSQSSF